MTKKNPHVIMGQTVQGSPAQGYTIEIKQYDSTAENAYQPDAQAMLNELEKDLERMQRLINARTRKLDLRLT